MPIGPKGQKRPADVIGNAIHIARLATGEIEEGAPIDYGKDPAAKALGAKEEPRGRRHEAGTSG